MLKQRKAELVHVKHSGDGYPLCWPMDKDGPFTASYYERDANCPKCMAILDGVD